MNSDTGYMRIALEEARMGALEGEIPVGAAAVFEGHVIARAHNRVESLRDASAHAEMTVLKAASSVLDRWRLTGVTLYVTIEPCPMCAMALVLSRVDRVVFGAPEPRTGAAGSFIRILGNPALNHRPDILGGVLSDEASALLREFFRNKRTAGSASHASTDTNPSLTDPENHV